MDTVRGLRVELTISGEIAEVELDALLAVLSRYPAGIKVSALAARKNGAVN